MRNASAGIGCVLLAMLLNILFWGLTIFAVVWIAVQALKAAGVL